ncbi:hypothetical protein DNTS_018017 [Danionella cerebrum]|uniref:Uncharacterized protein n=1 Tax=Danionella cerebrum TaxID=2873325 RepID=A0A553NK77_9TELE|nr:hypothetical protein DNTS_018017 [Danionella translucida]
MLRRVASSASSVPLHRHTHPIIFSRDIIDSHSSISFFLLCSWMRGDCCSTPHLCLSRRDAWFWEAQ